MNEIRMVNLAINCTEKIDDKHHCEKCSHTLTDFTNKTTEELTEEINKAQRPVCGLFKKSL